MKEMIAGSTLTVIGVIMLIYAFISVKDLIGNITVFENLIINLILIIIMFGIGGYLTGKGVFLLKG